MKRKPASIALAGMLSICVAGTAFAQLAQSKIVDGVEIDWGLMPSQDIARSHNPAELAMHGGPGQGPDEYHLTVSLRNATTKRQIRGARVEASIFPVSMAGPWKALQPMYIGSTVTYGNYFFMNERQAVPYRIKLEIWLPTQHQPITAEFTHHPD